MFKFGKKKNPTVKESMKAALDLNIEGICLRIRGNQVNWTIEEFNDSVKALAALVSARAQIDN